MSRADELRLLTRIARLYHEQNHTQAEIAAQLNLSQARVSRLLTTARDEGIVRISVTAPHFTYPELEERLEAEFGLKEAIVVDSVADDEEQLFRDIGSAAAFHVETTLKQNEVIGISSWSATLLAMVDAMHPFNRDTQAKVVQILGGVGNRVAEVHATQLAQRLAQLLRGETVLLPAPGIVGSADAKRVLMSDPFVQETFRLMDDVTIALVGIGALQPSSLLTDSGNIFSDDDIARLAEFGAVGDICQRFFDATGKPVSSPVDDRVIGMDFEQLSKVPRVVGAAGGARKTAAIRAAAIGGWINVLVTDRATAERLLGMLATPSSKQEVSR
jgi:DNA-binding transcriptional regulator LsrR (DeoR family)